MIIPVITRENLAEALCMQFSDEPGLFWNGLSDQSQEAWLSTADSILNRLEVMQNVDRAGVGLLPARLHQGQE
jgi:hypothetical protein